MEQVEFYLNCLKVIVIILIVVAIMQRVRIAKLENSYDEMKAVKEGMGEYYQQVQELFRVDLEERDKIIAKLRTDLSIANDVINNPHSAELEARN